MTNYPGNSFAKILPSGDLVLFMKSKALTYFIEDVFVSGYSYGIIVAVNYVEILRNDESLLG